MQVNLTYSDLGNQIIKLTKAFKLETKVLALRQTKRE